jgi:acyl-[acyl-carrier-protein] desaturase
MRTSIDEGLLVELAPEAERLYERHVTTGKEWFPHELIPYSRGRDMPPGTVWKAEDADLGGAVIDDAVRAALYVNLLTEDNLPYYSRDIDDTFGDDGIWSTWTKRWTAEEGRHSMAIYGYLMVTRAIDPVWLERGRLIQVSNGETPTPRSVAHGIAYVALQELATRIAHRNTGKLLNDPVGYDLMARVAADENLHYLFYRDLMTELIAVDPSTAVIAIADEVMGFAMPGTGIPDFTAHANAIARAGIYDLSLHHEQILVPVVLRHWKLAELTGLSPEAEIARAKTIKQIDRIGKVAKRLKARQQEQDAALQPA